MREAWNKRAGLVFASLALIVASAAPVAAQKKKPEAKAESSASSSDEVARGLFQAGKAAYEAGNYADALDFFEQAHERSGRPELLFNIGQAADRLRQDGKAIEALRAYVTQLPNAANRVEVEARIRALEAAQTERKNAEALAPVTPEPAAAAVPTPEETAQQAPAAEDNEIGATEGEPAASKPVTKQWWFWTGIGAVVVGGTAVALAVALGGDDGGREPYYEGNGGSLQGP
jgi:tetratricopeptide (TPR) repeat protein